MRIDPAQVRKMEETLGCKFVDDGEFAEMYMDITNYAEQTRPIEGVEFGFFHGDVAELRAAVAEVEEEWVKYFNEGDRVFCGFVDGEIASFCLIDEFEQRSVLADDGHRIGGPGCVGTRPAYRRRGVGMRMVDLATVWLREHGFDVGYIHYTHIDKWYAKLGYRTVARFDFPE